MSIKQFFIGIAIFVASIFVLWIPSLFVMESSQGIKKGDWYFVFFSTHTDWILPILLIGLFLFVFGMGLLFNKIKI